MSSVFFLVAALCVVFSLVDSISSHEFKVDGKVLELDESNFDAAISSFDYIFVDFYAPWCGHCKRLSPELDKAAPMLSGLTKPIVIAKVNADKYSRLASKYEIDGFPTLKVFMHGVPTEYNGPRKSDLLVRYLRKFVAPDVTVLESDSAITEFVEAAGTAFPIFIGFGLDESAISNLAIKFKKNAWFSVAKDFSEKTMALYDFDKVPALLALHPSFSEQSIFYGPFEDKFLGEFIQQSLLPLTLPMSPEGMKLLKDDDRKIVLTIVEDDTHTLSVMFSSVTTPNHLRLRPPPPPPFHSSSPASLPSPTSPTVRSPLTSPISATVYATADTACLSRSPTALISPPSLYETLGISMGATDGEIKTAYRRLARISHPDVKDSSSSSSGEEFMKIHAAYSTLSDPDKRADYDRRLFRTHRSRSYSSVRTTSSSYNGFSGYGGRNWETDQCW